MTKAMWTGILAAVCAFAAPAFTQAKEDKAPVAPAARADEDNKPQPYVVIVGIDNYADKEILPRAHAEADAKRSSTCSPARNTTAWTPPTPGC